MFISQRRPDKVLQTDGFKQPSCIASVLEGRKPREEQGCPSPGAGHSPTVPAGATTKGWEGALAKAGLSPASPPPGVSAGAEPPSVTAPPLSAGSSMKQNISLNDLKTNDGQALMTKFKSATHDLEQV